MGGPAGDRFLVQEPASRLDKCPESLYSAVSANVNANVNANNMLSQNRRITIQDVARQAGVSTQTVSRVINDRPDVATHTRQRVAVIVERIGYHPSELARSLVHQRSLTIGVVTAGLQEIGPSRTLKGIVSRAEELGYAVILQGLSRYSADDLWPILHGLFARQVDGILWAVPEVGNNRVGLLQSLGSIPIPIVFLTMQPQAGVSMLSVDNYAGGILATTHLLDMGRKRIAHISGPLDWWESRERKQGWRDALAQAGRRALDSQCAEGDWSAASGEAAFDRLLLTYPRMDAIFVGNDQMATAVLRTACQQGMRIPDDLAVVGFDNIAEASYLWPALTTVAQDQQQLGGRAVEELMQRIEDARNGKTSAARQILISPRVVVRESAAGYVGRGC